MHAGAIPAISQEMKTHLGLGQDDILALRGFAPIVSVHFEKIVSHFDQYVQATGPINHPVISEPGRESLIALFRQWLEGFWSGAQYEENHQRAQELGKMWQKSGVPSRYATGSIFVLQDQLFELLEQSDQLNKFTIQSAITKALGVELIVMLEAYCGACFFALSDAGQREKNELSRKLSESERAEELTIEEAAELIIGLDNSGRILFLNKAAEQMTGLRREDAKGQSFYNLLEKSIQSSVSQILQKEIRERPAQHQSIESAITRSGGQKYYIRWHFVPPMMRMFQAAHAVAVGADVTEQKLLAEKARKAERLAAVGTLANGLAHEIRNPLNGARLHLTFVERAMKKLSVGGEVTDALSVVNDEISRLALLVEDFSEFARPMTLQTGPRNLMAICEESVNENTPKALAAKVHLRLEQSEPDLLVEADTDKVRQALNNLVQNAIEAVAQMGSGTVIVRAHRRNQKEAIVEVEDDGIGLSSPDAPVFDAFYSTKAGGTGLGLAIVHRIVSDHGGSVGVESMPGRTIFWMTLPLSAESARSGSI